MMPSSNQRYYSRFIPSEEVGAVTQWKFGAVDGSDLVEPEPEPEALPEVPVIDEAAQFLIGSCSCQVKEQNPGMDIAMAVDWKQLVKDQATPGQKLPELKDMADLLPSTVTIQQETPASESPLKSDWKLVILAVALVGGLLVWKRFGSVRR